MGMRHGSNFSGNNRNKRRIGKRGLGREKITMLVTSLVVLSALTVTGIYIGQKNEAQNDNQRIDFSSLEEENTNDTADAGDGTLADDQAGGFVEHNDLDVDPELYRQYQEANSGDVLNPDLAKGNQAEEQDSQQEDENRDEPENTADQKQEDVAESMSSMTQAEIIQEKTQALIFDESASLAWPVVGNVVINYSMDSYVYYPTLGQYKYSPAIVISAVEGENITAAADGVVSEVFYNEEIGNAVTVALGSGYELTYGQLADIQVAAGDTVNQGDLLGTVAAPTKYYTLEGTNVYFAMTRDGEPVNPLTLLQ